MIEMKIIYEPFEEIVIKDYVKFEKIEDLIYGFAQLWSLIGYSISFVVVLTGIPRSVLFMDLLFNIFPSPNIMPVYRLLFRYFQIFGIISLISFLYGVHMPLNREETPTIFLGRHLVNKNFNKVTSRFLVVGFTCILSFYIFSAYTVSYCSVGEWELIWPTSEPGTFFPWPAPSGHEGAFSRSDNLVDFILFVFFIQTGLLLILTVLLWDVTAIILYKSRNK